MFLEEDSIAEEWYDKLSAADKAGSWANFVSLFNMQFLSQKEKKDARTYLNELEAMRVTNEQLLVQHEKAQVLYHKWFVEHLLALAKGAKIDQSKEAIVSTQKNLPYVLKKVVSNDHADWESFTNAIKGVNWALLKVEAEHEIDAQKVKEQMEILQATPRTKLASSLESTQLVEPLLPTPN
ncbi:hypothetical protein GYMLUDRAFT_62366 [Collybiopsis luxurians FD-317 M1]|uniref:Uncharacterized protein n=1 Tax=Collybiopsis luxurians FD-317 M1 TaxID=944289 RepID=A0A0D0BLX1_9AGAR|nr:hypothetical protein GYMLUDRAFT_62366 [Collybiopsis luxurians FD-317 M1]